MKSIAGYAVVETLNDGTHWQVHRAFDEAAGRSVICKSCKLDFPPPKVLARLRIEHDMLNRLAFDGVVRAEGLVKDKHRLVLVLGDSGGIPLDEIIARRRLDAREFLQLAIRIADIFERIHRSDVIHKDVNPSNIIWNEADDVVQIIDFELATGLLREREAVQNPDSLEGTLAYMSPEQTGRMNRAIDYRSDLYSLGATFYHMLTGAPPFASGDAMEMVHCHLAKVPTAPSEIDGAIPPLLSEIVLRMLAKTAESRYQSASGVKHDLERCLDALDETGAIEPFSLGQGDLSERLRLSQTLYGREAEIEILMDSFERAGGNAAELVLVGGYSGVGKTSLIEEIHRPIVKRRGYFVSGKFDQFQRDVPYSSIIQAFRNLVAQLLTESESRVREWAGKLSTALDALGQVIIDVIPEVELIIGPQPPVVPLSGNEAQTRFQSVFESFLGALCSADHPLVLFLDDLQWADQASLKLLQLITTGSSQRHLLILCAYRDNEVSPEHPFMLTLAAIGKERAYRMVELAPLDLHWTNELIADSLATGADRTLPLAQLIHRKTLGNPFFINRLLTAIYERGQLRFDPAAGRWAWEMDEIRAMEVSDNIVDLMVAKINQLPEVTRDLLQQASCLGTLFEISALSAVCGRPIPETSQALRVAVREELLRPMDKSFRYLEWADEEEWSGADAVDTVYRFFHDRIQEAANSGLAEERRRRIHWQAGMHLLERTEGEEGGEARDKVIFDIVNHLNEGRLARESGPGDVELAELNLRAGRRARASIAHAATLGFVRRGIELLTEEGWRTHHGLMFDLYMACAEAAHLSGEREESDRLFAVIDARAESRLEKALLAKLMLDAYLPMGRRAEGMKASEDCLRLFDIEFPSDPAAQERAVQEEHERILGMLAGRQVAELIELPVMKDQDMALVVDILYRTWTHAYHVNYTLGTLAALRIVTFSLEHGHAPFSAFGYIIYASILSSVYEDYDQAFEYGELALKLDHKFENVEIIPKVNNMFAHTVNHYKLHMRTNIPYYEESYHAALICGDLWWGIWACDFITLNKLIKGDPLEQVLETSEQYSGYVEKAGDVSMLGILRLAQHVVLNLQGKTRGADSLTGDPFDEEAFLETAEAIPFHVAIFVTRLYQTVVRVINGRFSDARPVSDHADEMKVYLPGFMLITEHEFYRFMTLAGGFDDAAEEERPALRETMDAIAEKMARWAGSGPDNYRHKHLLMTAELARIDGDDWAAASHYEEAAAAARDADYLHLEALAFERAARFYLQRGKSKAARGYLEEARYLYLRWGASRKVAALEEEFGGLVSRAAARAGSLSSVSDDVSELTTHAPIGALDAVSIVKASQTISGEIYLGPLLQRMMRLILENGGAQSGVLLLERDGGLKLEAQGTVEPDRIEVLQGTIIDGDRSAESGEDRPPLPLAMVRLVEKTKTPLVIDDAGSDLRFLDDPYCREVVPRSVLCTPILSHGRLKGILYLENNLVTGAFTPQRQEVLSLLASQATISIENALLYADMEASEKRYRSLYDNAVEGLFRTTWSGNLLGCNQALARILGYDAPDALVEMVSDVGKQLYVDPGDRERMWAMIVERGRVLDFETRLRRRDGAEIWVSMSVQEHRDEAGELEYIEGVLLDIGERKARERAELERQEAEIAGRAKSEFLARMSHEIRTPMNAVIGLTQLAMRTDPTAKQRDYLRKIDSSAQALLGILNDILDFSKIEAGKLALESTSFDLNEVLDNLGNVLSLAVHEKGIELLFDIDADLPSRVMGDPLRLAQVLINLGSNAVKFTDQGEVTVSVRLAASGDDSVRLAFAVRDSGIGMSAEQMEGLFQSFHQVDASITRRFGGTGLGLTISKQLVHMMGGELSVESTLGEGSTFRFEARFGASPDAPARGRVLPPELQGRTVLVVDDNEIARTVLSRMLANFSFEVEAVASGEEAVNRMRERYDRDGAPFDAVLLDWRMPGMNGLETARRIQADTALPHSPAILMVTAYGGEELEEEARSAGLDGFLTKPVAPSLLLNMLLETFGVDGEGLVVDGGESRSAARRLDAIVGAPVLLVEDNLINQQVATEFLEQAGLVVTVAENGREGVARVLDGDYALVLMDVQMPEMDGLEATRRIRSAGRTALPIVAMTAHAMASDRRASLDAGMNDHLTKPIMVEELERVLLRWIEPRSMAGEHPPATAAAGAGGGAPSPSGDLPLPAVDGLDCEAGVRFSAGNRGLYVTLLKGFAQRYTDAPDRLTGGVEAGDFEAAQLLAHSVKGTASTLGAETLSRSAAALEKALREADLPAVHYTLEPTVAQLGALCDGLNRWIAELDVVEEGPADADVAAAVPMSVDLAPLLDELEGLVESGNFKAERMIEEVKLLLAGRGVDELLERIETAFGDLELEDAAAAVGALKARMAEGA